MANEEFIEALVASGSPFGIAQSEESFELVTPAGEVLTAAGTYEAALKELSAQLSGDTRPVLPERWRSDMAFEGVDTGDGRFIQVGAITFRNTPLPLMLQTETEVGHFGAVLAGTIDEVGMVATTALGRGTFDESDAGSQALSVIQARERFGVSVDIGTADGTVDEETGKVTFTKAEIMGLTMTPFPAFADAYIEIDNMVSDSQPVAASGTLTTLTYPPFASTGVATSGQTFITSTGTTIGTLPYKKDDECLECQDELLADSAPVSPPSAWFENPQFVTNDERLVEQPNGGWACPLTVTEEGHVYGHLAAFRSCHTSYADRCVPPPHSPSGYAYFTTGTVTTAEGEIVRVGQLTMGAGHAPTSRGASLAEVRAHYDGGPGAIQMADVAVGEDEFGIWFAGALRPEVTDEQVRAFMACGVSGDWREVVRGKGLDLVACAAGIPVPGFPIARALAASAALDIDVDLPRPSVVFDEGSPVALVAAGSVRQPLPWEKALAHQQHEIEILKGEVLRLQKLTSPLRPLAAERLADVINS